MHSWNTSRDDLNERFESPVSREVFQIEFIPCSSCIKFSRAAFIMCGKFRHSTYKDVENFHCWSRKLFKFSKLASFRKLDTQWKLISLILVACHCFHHYYFTLTNSTDYIIGMLVQWKYNYITIIMKLAYVLSRSPCVIYWYLRDN